MSRAVMAWALLIASPVIAQTPGQDAVAVQELVKTKTEEIITVQDKKKCPEVLESDGIVVCAEIDNGEDQLIFGDQRVPQSSGANRNADAAACIAGTGCRVPLQGGVTIGFGKRRPPVIPYEKFLEGLLEPDAVVSEEQSATPTEVIRDPE